MKPNIFNKILKALLCMVVVFHSQPSSAKNFSKPTTHYLKYDKEKVRLDIYNSGKKNSPVVILIHGAAGISGDRAVRYKNFATDLMHKDMVAVNVYYFQSNRSNWIKTITKTIDYSLSIDNIDKNKICIVGYSLGGTIALAVASKDYRVSLLVINSGYLPNGFTREHASKLPQTYILAGTKDTAINTLYKIESWLKESGVPVKTKINYGEGHTIPTKLFRKNWRSIVFFISNKFNATIPSKKNSILIQM